ncbi:peptidoglycan-binding domain-containing protein [Streptomyces sp. AM 2-1-1]|uniref:peptidoglycan-binding domain-containing protein n=1 Tax=Streptomyces sp. AM 2-1-1 TaxID=3028709 RepID=UPI0023B98089|nr:peptidoglycan-binding domain-containing protein [Streptomyces sp. AM 2-1-1]WEH42080.1 peptidoglycan-binding domain-containing protein [Streptomyces sp. AM 2-1-1]
MPPEASLTGAERSNGAAGSFTGAATGAGAGSATGARRADPVQPRRRRPFVALGVAVAVAAMVGTASVLGGVFDGDEAARQESLPEATTSVPDATAEPTDAPVAPSVSGSASAAPSASATSASPSASASASASESPSAEATATATATAAPESPTPSNPTSAPPVAVAPPATTAPPAVASLQRGDYGPEVAELQTRLREVRIFYGPADSNYTDRVQFAVSAYQAFRGIQGDPSGVYGPQTRSALEAETTGESRH